MSSTSPENAPSPTEHPFRQTAEAAIADKTKPPGSLGQLEALAVQISCLQGSVEPVLEPACTLVFAADHGVAAAGVSAYPQEVTAQMMANFDAGGAAVSVLCRSNGLSLEATDVGVAADLSSLKNIVHAKVRPGTANLCEGDAMSTQECDAAMSVGAMALQRAQQNGMRCIALGEMGIANTTSAAILTGHLTHGTAAQVVGRGTGIDNAALAQKQAIVQQVLQELNGATPRQALRRAGGLEIAALVGLMLQAPEAKILLLIDGYIVTSAALLACRLNPAVRDCLVFSHQSAEPGHERALVALQAHPILKLQLRLGEGSGAALAYPIVKAAANIMRDMATFSAAGVSNAN